MQHIANPDMPGGASGAAARDVDLPIHLHATRLITLALIHSSATQEVEIAPRSVTELRAALLAREPNLPKFFTNRGALMRELGLRSQVDGITRYSRDTDSTHLIRTTGPKEYEDALTSTHQFASVEIRSDASVNVLPQSLDRV